MISRWAGGGAAITSRCAGGGAATTSRWIGTAPGGSAPPEVAATSSGLRTRTQEQLPPLHSSAYVPLRPQPEAA